MRVKWLLERDMFMEGNPERMKAILDEMNIEAKWVRYVPFEGGAYDQFPEGSCVIVYGSLNLANQIAKWGKWVPGVWTNERSLRCSTYLAHWGAASIQKDYAMYPLAEVRRLLPGLLQRFGEDQCLFIRPNENDKSFSGAVVAGDDFERWYAQNSKCYDLDPTSLAVVSRPQRILSEHRFIVAGKKVVTGSKYRHGGKLLDGLEAAGYDPPAWEYAQRLVSESFWAPLPIFSLDVAQVEEGYSLLEIGSVNSCGLYGCDLRIFIQEASQMALAECDSKEKGLQCR